MGFETAPVPMRTRKQNVQLQCEDTSRISLVLSVERNTEGFKEKKGH